MHVLESALALLPFVAAYAALTWDLAWWQRLLQWWARYSDSEALLFALLTTVAHEVPYYGTTGEGACVDSLPLLSLTAPVKRSTPSPLHRRL